jgi:hypothetical protein
MPIEWKIDPKTFFPMIEFHDLPYQVAWLPMTKIQVEYMLSETTNSRFDRTWYRNVLRNLTDQTIERPSAAQVSPANFCEAFLSRVVLPEARLISQWWGVNFDIPTEAEWKQIIELTDTLPADEANIMRIGSTEKLHPRARRLVEVIERAAFEDAKKRGLTERKVSHQMLLRKGLREYVYLDEQRNSCTAYGETARTTGIKANDGPNYLPLSPFIDPSMGERQKDIGFRLVMHK